MVGACTSQTCQFGSRSSVLQHVAPQSQKSQRRKSVLPSVRVYRSRHALSGTSNSNESPSSGAPASTASSAVGLFALHFAVPFDKGALDLGAARDGMVARLQPEGANLREPPMLAARQTAHKMLGVYDWEGVGHQARCEHRRAIRLGWQRHAPPDSECTGAAAQWSPGDCSAMTPSDSDCQTVTDRGRLARALRTA